MKSVRRILSRHPAICITKILMDSIIALINKLCDMAFNLRDKSMEIKMLIDIGFIMTILRKKVTNITLQTCNKLNTSAYGG